MAVIEQLEYGNAFTYRKCIIPLSNQGFVYLCGKNGTGKSTPWEILQHVFYGTTSRGLKKKGIICTVPREDIDEDESFWAEAILRNDSGKYEGRWLIKQKQPLKDSLKVEVLKEVNGDWKKKWEGGGCPPRSPDAQKLASELIGLRQNEFEGCLYLSQSGAHTLIEGVPSERMLYLSRLFGIDICDDVLKELKDRLKALNVDLEDVIGLEARAVDLQERISGMRAVKEILGDITEYEESSELAAKKIEDWKNRRDKARDDVKTAEDRAQLQEELDELGDVDLDDYEDVTEDLNNSTQRRDTIRDDIQSAKMRDSIVTKIEELGPQVDDVPDNVDEVLDGWQTERAKLTSDVTAAKDRVAVEEKLAELDQSLDATDLEERIAFVDKDLEVNRQQYKTDTAQHKELSDLIEKAGKGDCPTCHRPLNVDDMVSMRDKLEGDLQVLYAEIQPKKKKVSDFKIKLVDAKKVRDLKAKLEDMPEHDLSDLREKRAKLKTEISRLTASRDKVNDLSSLEEQLEELPEVDGLEDLQEELSKLDEKIPKLKADVERIDKSVFLKQRIEKLLVFDKEEAEEELDLANEVYGEVQKDSEEITKHLVAAKLERDNQSEVQERIDDVDASLEALSDTRRRKRTLEYAAAAMPRIKKRKLHKVICAIRDILPRYAGTMFSHEPNTTFLVSEDEESLELVCRRLVKVHGRLEPVFVPVKGFSGGEKQRLSVALLFTLHALLDPTKRPDLLVLDEVDKGLDEMGVASLMALVNEVRNQYGTVIMTSHRTEISGADFDRVWRVTKDNEESTLALTA